MSEIRGLSVTQPWASLIACGGKQFETRNWATPYRGLLVIHAAKTFPTAAVEFAEQDIVLGPLTRAGIVPSWWQPWDMRGYSLKDFLPLGACIAVATLQNCLATPPSNVPWREYAGELRLPPTGDELAFGDYSPGRYAWLLADVRRLATPIACRGDLGLWRVSDDVVAQIRAQRSEVS